MLHCHLHHHPHHLHLSSLSTWKIKTTVVYFHQIITFTVEQYSFLQALKIKMCYKSRNVSIRHGYSHFFTFITKLKHFKTNIPMFQIYELFLLFIFVSLWAHYCLQNELLCSLLLLYPKCLCGWTRTKLNAPPLWKRGHNDNAEL